MCALLTSLVLMALGPVPAGDEWRTIVWAQLGMTQGPAQACSGVSSCWPWNTAFLTLDCVVSPRTTTYTHNSLSLILRYIHSSPKFSPHPSIPALTYLCGTEKEPFLKGQAA